MPTPKEPTPVPTPIEPTPVPTPKEPTPVLTPMEPTPVPTAFLPRRLGIRRSSRLRRVLAVGRHAGTELMPILFAALAFAASFILPAVREAGKKKDGAEFEYMLRLAWARTRRRLTLIGAPEVDRDGYAFKDDLRDAAQSALISLGFKPRALTELLPRIEHEYRATLTGERSASLEQIFVDLLK